MSEAFFARLARRTAARYPARDRYARHFAYGKLTRDPMFRHLLRQGLIPSRGALLDLGCGQGLLAALVAEAASMHAAGDWPGDWPAPPRDLAMHGIDLGARDIERARHAASCARFDQGDIRRMAFERADAVTLLDVLQYIDPQEQRDVLARIRDCLAPGGVLLLRVADAARSMRFRFTVAVDRAATWLRGQGAGRLHCRPLAAWQRELRDVGFDASAVPMSEGTGFANVLLVARA